MKDFQFVIQNFLKNHEKHKKYIALLLVLSIVVSFAVPFSLIMPAVSMTGELICGMEEHIHSDECYELSCGLEESDEHLHNADCYTLVCDIPEHIHSQECYSDYQEENNFDFENLSPDAINISNVMATDEQGRTLVSNMNGGVDANDGYSKGQLSEVSLLIGDGVEWASDCKTASDVIEAAKRKYFLGIASDFSIFLENDFRPLNSDTEGRVATGGDAFFDTTNSDWNYQIGNGDYAESIALKSTGDYNGRSNFAHIITKGGIKNINLISQGSNKGDNYIYEEDKYKRFVVSTDADLTNLDQFAHRAGSTLYSNECATHLVSPLNELAQFYKADLINFTETFAWLRQQSEKLSKKTATGTYEYKDESLSTDNSNDNGSRYTLILTGPGINSDINTVYFSLPSWDSNVRRIMFKDIPNNANLVVNCGGEKVIIGGTGDNDKMIYTYINGKMISNTGTNDKSTNNNEKSSKILYNFYQAVSDSDYNSTVKLSEDSSQKNKAGVYVNTNFNGTIFAPNADVRSEDGCDGHLSGSLIAKTFTGGLEFGYRPYRGGMEDILGSSMGYTIPVDKFVTGVSGQWLAGAKFDITDNEGKVVNSFTSGDGTNYVDIPSKVDFTGGTNYTGVESLTGTYTIKEVSAPEGYIADTENTCTVTITEEIQSDGLIETGSGTIPTHIIATVQFGSNSPFIIDLKDIYSYDGSSSKQIRRELTIGSETFYLEIDNGKVSAVSKQDNTAETQTGTYVSVLNPNSETNVVVHSTSYSNVLDENRLTQTETSVKTIYDKPIAKYNIRNIAYNGNSDPNISNVKFILYYSDGSNNEISPTFKSGADDWSNPENYWHEFQIDNAIQNVVGFKIVRVSTNENNENVYNNIGEDDLLNNIVFQDESWNIIEGLRGNWGVTDSNQITAETTTRTEITSWVVTTDVEVSYLSTSYCTQFTSDTYYIYPKMQLSESIGNKQTVTTTITLEGGVTKEKKYYYNPDDIMMMPMPSENLKFENRCGLLFKKVDSNGNPLSGATIKLQYKDVDKYTDVDNSIWNWTGSSFTIDPVNLDSTEVYRFHEESAPTGYETAPDIYFKKTDTNKILWGYAENNLENNLDLTYDNNRTITMTDTKITGAKVKLKKTKDDGTTLLDGAKFKLYSADDETTPIYPTLGDGFTVTNGEIDLYETFKNGSSNANADYIQNGYLKEGLYYLYEVSAPTGYQAGQKFYFTVNKNNGLYDVVTGKPTYLTKENHTYHSNDELYYGDEYSGVAISKIEIDVENANGAGIQFKPTGDNTVLQKDGLTNGTFTIDLASEGKSLSFGDGGRMKITFWNCDITDIRYYIDSSSSGGSSSTAYDIGGIVWNSEGNSSINVDKLTLYYQDETNASIQNVKWSGENYWYPFDLQTLSKNGVVAVKLETSGSGTFKLLVRDTSWKIDIWSGDVTAGQTYIFGTIPTTGNNSGSTDPDTPTGGEGGNTSNNTEEGAIDKDTTAPAGYVGLIAKNSPMGDKTSITVKKNWVDDNGYETLRPDKIIVQLYRSTDPNLSTDNLTDDMKSGDSVTIQDTNGKWEHTWTNLDTKDESNNNYYYYVKEVTDLNNYTVSYENNGISSGDIKIKNTLKTVDISVKKDWSVPDGVTGVTNPSSVTVKLQTSSDGTDNSWTDTGKTLTLSESNSWTGKFEKLPEGKYYRVVETNIPNGWTASYSTDGKKFDNSGNITVTNTLSLASLNIKKNWEDNVGDVRPDKINIKLYRSTTPPAGSATSNSVQPISLQEPTNNYEDYSRLLQYSLYFYDANMCGDDVANSSDLTWRNNCHKDDAVRGGYHDAGDHVMFGLPQGYTASTLGWSYYENKAIYDGLGQTEHYQKIMKRFCDFFVASTTLDSNNNVTNFLYQKGNGGTDHNYWGSPENQTQEQRGELLYTNNSASDIAAEYAAALAQYAKNFPNDSRKEDYLNCAKALYAYSVRTNKSASVGEYTSTSYKDDQAWAAAWLYLATNEETYKTNCKNLLDTFKAIADKRGYFWGDVELGAMVVYKRFIDSTYDWSIATNYLSSKCQGDSFVVLDNWGSARHNTALQMVALSASKFSDNDDINYTEWCKKQMNYILGNNSISSNENSSTCFVVGFADNSAKYPHHRGASGVSGWDSYNASDGTYPNGHELVGALVAGPKADGSYNDNFKDTVGNEVALDYNATLVGAAAALFAKYGTGTLVTDASQIGTKREVKNVYLQPNPVLTVYGKSTMYKDKTQILTAENATGTVTWSSSESGILTVDENGLVTAVSNGKATITATDSSDNSTASFDITVTSSAITPDIPEGAELVDTITLSSSKSWQEIPNLPITDGQGNTYYYYIAEVDDRGEIISNKVSGYIPVEYDNGKSLSEGNTELSVTNKKSDVDEGSMPSTGGTGTQPYKVIGMVMAGGALIMLGIRRRKKHC